MTAKNEVFEALSFGEKILISKLIHYPNHKRRHVLRKVKQVK